MATREEIIKSSGYWLEEIQGEVFRLLKEYMDKNNLSQKDIATQLGFSPSYVSQILNGNFNFTISKLVELSLSVGKVPEIKFTPVNDFLQQEINPGLHFRYTFDKNSDGGSVAIISSKSVYEPTYLQDSISFNH